MNLRYEGKVYRFPKGTSQETAMRYLKQQVESGEGESPNPPEEKEKTLLRKAGDFISDVDASTSYSFNKDLMNLEETLRRPFGLEDSAFGYTREDIEKRDPGSGVSGAIGNLLATAPETALSRGGLPGMVASALYGFMTADPEDKSLSQSLFGQDEHDNYYGQKARIAAEEMVLGETFGAISGLFAPYLSKVNRRKLENAVKKAKEDPNSEEFVAMMNIATSLKEMGKGENFSTKALTVGRTPVDEKMLKKVGIDKIPTPQSFFSERSRDTMSSSVARDVTDIVSEGDSKAYFGSYLHNAFIRPLEETIGRELAVDEKEEENYFDGLRFLRKFSEALDE